MAFQAAVKDIIKDVEGYTDSRLNGIVMEMSVIDKTAVVQKDRKGNVLTDPTTKDTEIIRLNQDVQAYFNTEVLPHVPDAIWAYEFNPKKAVNAQNRERLGAEFMFTRYFYEYHELESTDSLYKALVDAGSESMQKLTVLLGGVSSAK